MSEYDEQCAVVEYCDAVGVPIAHVANEGKRSNVGGARLKRAGMRPGFPDLLVPVARGGYHSLYIELKAEGGKASEGQVRWLWRLREEGMAAFLCFGSANAIACIEWYMSL